MFTVGLPMLILLIVTFIGEWKQLNRNIIIERQMEISSVVVDGSYGYGRGGIYISRDSVIGMSSMLIGDDLQNNELWKIVYRRSHRYRLGDLSFPYELSKKANNDTIVVHKDRYEFKFLLNTME